MHQASTTLQLQAGHSCSDQHTVPSSWGLWSRAGDKGGPECAKYHGRVAWRLHEPRGGTSYANPEIREGFLEEGTGTSGFSVGSDRGRSVLFTSISLGLRTMPGKSELSGKTAEMICLIGSPMTKDESC